MMFLRSALYVPADHDRAMAKAVSLDADIIIYDLEDGVAPEKKAAARAAIMNRLEAVIPAKAGIQQISQTTAPQVWTPVCAGVTKLTRINHCSTPYYNDDIAALVACPLLDGIMLSKVAGVADIDDALGHLARHDRADLPIWCNVETPLGIEHAFEIAAHPAVYGLVAGTNDLTNDLRIQRTPDRLGLMHSLQRLMLAARAHGKIVLDGTFIDFNDEAGLRAEAQQGKMLGFDGKTLVHPRQIAIANEVFGVSETEKATAREIVTAYEQAMQEGKAVILLNGQMIERLHYDRAKKTLQAK